MPVITKIFEYGDREMQYLMNADPLLGEAIERIGFVERVIIPDIFQALIHAVIGQQISLKASKTVWSRLLKNFEEFTPEVLAGASLDEIKECGISLSKGNYIKGIADCIAKGTFDLQELYALSDKEIIKRLSTLNGIGEWTAEMLLLNCMERPNILSYGDIAIRRSIMKLYGLSELPREEFMVYKNRYSPYASVASIYLWKLSYE